jgi:adenylylsulfate kinase-like enzyme
MSTRPTQSTDVDQAPSPTAQPLVWINGFPGAGKLTVVRALARLAPTAIVLDNHQLIDPVEAHYPRSHADYQRQRRLYRQAVFTEHVCAEATLGRVVVFTGEDCLLPPSLSLSPYVYIYI